MFRIRENEIADALTTADLWQIMLKEVPPIAAEYFIGGAGSLNTLKSNVLAFQQVMLAPSGAIKHKKIETKTEIFGHELSVPFSQLCWKPPYIVADGWCSRFSSCWRNSGQPLLQLFQ